MKCAATGWGVRKGFYNICHIVRISCRRSIYHRHSQGGHGRRVGAKVSGGAFSIDGTRKGCRVREWSIVPERRDQRPVRALGAVVARVEGTSGEGRKTYGYGEGVKV